MNREFVSYEEALALRELGFNEPCFTSYDDEKRLRNPFDYKNSDYYLSVPYIEDSRHWIFNSELTIENFIGNKDLYTQFIAAPLYQQAFRWFREKDNIHVHLKKFNETKWWVEWGFWSSAIFDTYEQAQIASIKKIIEVLKEKQS